MAALFACGITAAPASGQASSDNRTAPAFDANRAWTHLRAIVAFGPRPAGSAQIRQTRAYITRQLAAMGLTVQEQPFTASTPIGPVAMSNLIVRLPGRRDGRLIIAGHYDTKLMRDQVFVGANDGGSSAAFLIELARVLQARPRELTYELVWFDGEEAFVEWTGLDHTYGSRFYVQAARQANALASIRALVLVDMIGDRELEIRRDLRSTTWLNDIIWAEARTLGLQRTFVDADTEIEDDHTPFVDAGIPSVDIIDLDYPAWHTPADTLDQVAPASLQKVGDVLLRALPTIERHLLR